MRFYVARDRADAIYVGRAPPERDLDGYFLNCLDLVLDPARAGILFDRVPDHGETIVVETREVPDNEYGQTAGSTQPGTSSSGQDTGQSRGCIPEGTGDAGSIPAEPPTSDNSYACGCAPDMERQLRANDHKGGWADESDSWLLGSMGEEVAELEVATDDTSLPGRASVESLERVIKEAADVANFAMMIADNARSYIESHNRARLPATSTRCQTPRAPCPRSPLKERAMISNVKVVFVDWGGAEHRVSLLHDQTIRSATIGALQALDHDIDRIDINMVGVRTSGGRLLCVHQPVSSLVDADAPGSTCFLFLARGPPAVGIPLEVHCGCGVTLSPRYTDAQYAIALKVVASRGGEQPLTVTSEPDPRSVTNTVIGSTTPPPVTTEGESDGA